MSEFRQVFVEYEPIEKTPSQVNHFCGNCGDRLKFNDQEQHNQCENCGRKEYFNPKPAVCSLVVYDNSVLLCRRNGNTIGKGKWCLPAGYVEWGEDFVSAAERETLEETGISMKAEKICNVVSNFFNPMLHSIVVVVLGRYSEGMPLGADDADEAKWFDLSNPLPSLAFRADAHIIERYRTYPDMGIPLEAL